MDLKDNPFYILKLPCSATRLQIYSAAEELSLWETSDRLETAQSTLLKPDDRLAAEMDWFPGLDGNQLEEICSCIAHDRPIALQGDDPLANLNSLLYNIGFAQEPCDSLRNIIMDADRVFGALMSADMRSRLSACHAMAGIPDPKPSLINKQLKEKRAETVRSLDLMLKKQLSEEQRTELMTEFGEGLQKSYSEIIADLIDQYELRMHDRIENQERMINAEIQMLRNSQHSLLLKEHAKTLVQDVRAWDVLTQPIQLKWYANGMSYQSGKKLGDSLVKLVISFYNDKKDPDAAMYLLNEMKPVFKEIPDITDQLIFLEKQLKPILEKLEEARKTFQSQQFNFPSSRIRSKPRTPDSVYWIVFACIVFFLLITCSISGGGSSYTSPGYTPLPTIRPYPLTSFDIGSLPVPSFNLDPLPSYSSSFQIPTLDPKIQDWFDSQLDSLSLPEDFVLPESFEIEESTEFEQP